MNLIAYIVAIFFFLVAVLFAPVWGASQLDFVAGGLAWFALAHILPPRP